MCDTWYAHDLLQFCWIVVTLVISYQFLWYHEDPCSILWYFILEIISLSICWHYKSLVHIVFGALELSCLICLWCCDTPDTDFFYGYSSGPKSYICKQKPRKWAGKQTHLPAWHEKVNVPWSLRLDYQPLFGKGARAPPLNSWLDSWT